VRIATITNWAYAITVVMTLCSGSAFILAAEADQGERVAVEERVALDEIADDIEYSVEMLTDEAQRYAVLGDPAHRDAWRQELTETRTREKAITRLRALGAPDAEIAELDEADRALDAVETAQLAAVEAASSGDHDRARALVFGKDYERLEAAADAPVQRFKALLKSRTQRNVAAARIYADRLDDIAKAMLGLTAALFLSVLYFVLTRRVAAPLAQMSNVVHRLAEQDYGVDIPNDTRRDEIGEMTRAIRIFRSNGMVREQLEQERAQDHRVRDRISRMMHRMQGCGSEEELAEVVACFAPQIFPDLAGRLFAFDAASGEIVSLAHWQEPTHSAERFPALQCWGLRRGHAHVSNGQRQDIVCPHLSDLGAHDCLCVPLMAQSDMVGVLYFEERGDHAAAGGAQHLYLELMAENIGLALANIRLRATLRSLAIRDPLTGLHNRRYLDETLNRALATAVATHEPLACLMIDIDHFKRFNDQFGHDAGDLVMQHVAQALLAACREGDSACRFGGEEFTMLLPGATVAEALARGEIVRDAVRLVSLAHRGRPLSPVTISVGVAAYPESGEPGSLLAAADSALLEAKRQGRDRVLAASNAWVASRVDAAE
jgi:diguanylate cyclase (GGDEF)-like protein